MDDGADITPGDFYEDCSGQPRVCVLADPGSDELSGISLITGQVGDCSFENCGPVPLTASRAIEIALTWPPQEVIDSAREQDHLIDVPGDRVSADTAQAYRDRLLNDPVIQHRLSRLNGNA